MSDLDERIVTALDTLAIVATAQREPVRHPALTQDQAMFVHVVTPAVVLALVAGLREIEAEHSTDRYGQCLTCRGGDHPDENEPWPCPTLLAVAKALRVEGQ